VSLLQFCGLLQQQICIYNSLLQEKNISLDQQQKQHMSSGIELNVEYVDGLQVLHKRCLYDTSKPFTRQLMEICKLFNIQEIRRDKFAIQLHSYTGPYIDKDYKVTPDTFGDESVRILVVQIEYYYRLTQYGLYIENRCLSKVTSKGPGKRGNTTDS
jgi:hypothetical protein